MDSVSPSCSTVPPPGVPGRAFLSRALRGRLRRGGRHPASLRCPGVEAALGPEARPVLAAGPAGRPADADSASCQGDAGTVRGDEVPMRGRASASLSFRPPPTPPGATGTRLAPQAAGTVPWWGDGAWPCPVRLGLHGCQGRCWSAHVSLKVSRCWATGGAGPHIGAGHPPPTPPLGLLRPPPLTPPQPASTGDHTVTRLPASSPGSDGLAGWEGVGLGRTHGKVLVRGPVSGDRLRRGGSGRQQGGQVVSQAHGGSTGEAGSPLARLTALLGAQSPGLGEAPAENLTPRLPPPPTPALALRTPPLVTDDGKWWGAGSPASPQGSACPGDRAWAWESAGPTDELSPTHLCGAPVWAWSLEVSPCLTSLGPWKVHLCVNHLDGGWRIVGAQHTAGHLHGRPLRGSFTAAAASPAGHRRPTMT